MKKTVILLVVAVALSFGAAFAAITFLSHPASPATTARVSAATPVPTPFDPGMIYPLPERVLNLVPSGGSPHYARIEVAIGFERPPGQKPPNPAAAGAKSTAPALEPGLAPVTAHRVQIDDALVRVVGSKTMEALATGDGREALKRDLLEAVRQIVPEPVATGVYIVNLVVQ